MTEMIYGSATRKVHEPVLPRWWRTLDKWTLAAILILSAFGILLGFAASVPLAEKNNLPPFYYVTRQMFYGSLAIGVILGTSIMPTYLIRRLGIIAFIITLVTLFLLPFMGTDHGKGAIRWFSFGPINAQPSEFLKPAFIIFSAWLMAGAELRGGPPGKILSFGFTILIVLLLALQPDFGQASLIVFSWMIIYFLAGAPLSLITILLLLAGVGGTVAYNSSEHLARRIDGFLSSDVDPRSQIGYATNAIQEGGIFGVGVGEGQVKRILPDAHTDFIIAVAAEEYGVIFVILIIALYMFIIIRSLMRLKNERDTFIRLAGAGLACIFGTQALINIGVAVRLLPAKGMTLPFISYGGSSVIATGLTVGMLLALTRERPQGHMGDILFRKGL